MKFKLLALAGACVLTFLSAGCYTELATREGADHGYADDEQDSYSSSTDTTDGSTVNNYYFGDDAYRESRFRSSFHYYYPNPGFYYNDGFFSYSIYDPWFDDPWYWTMGWRPYVLYPYPTWYPYGSYYGGHHYWGYYNGGYDHHGYGGGIGTPRNPQRQRLTGSMRDTRVGGSYNPISPISGTVTPPGTQGSVRQRGITGERPATTTTTTSPAERTRTTSRTRGNDTPWWERDKQTQSNRPADGQATTRTRRPQPGVDQTQRTGTSAQSPSQQGQVQDQPRREGRQRSSHDGGGQSSGRQTQSVPAQQPHYNPPPAHNGGGGGGR